MNPQDLTLAIRWFTAAIADVRAVQTLSAVQEPLCSLVCYHCQQAAERMLKGVLAFHGQNIPETHHIALLLRLVKEQSALLKDLTNDLSLLTVYAGENILAVSKEPTKEEMQRAISLVDTLQKALNKASYPMPA